MLKKNCVIRLICVIRVFLLHLIGGFAKVTVLFNYGKIFLNQRRENDRTA